MNHVLALALSLALLTSGSPLWSRAAGGLPASGAAAVTQTFTGGGSGREDVAEQLGHGQVRLRASGSYTTTSGQLGQGQLIFEEGISHNHALRPRARFVRSDGMTMLGTTVLTSALPGCPTDVGYPPLCITMELDGPDDIAHLHVELIAPRTGPGGPMSYLFRGVVTLRHRVGYAMVDTNGTAYAFGGIDHLGDAHTTRAVDLERTPSGGGYWIVNAAGNVYAFGDARHLGNADIAPFAPHEVVTSMSASPTGKGYWLFTSKGRALTFGDAKPFGDLHARPLNGPVVGSVATPTGKGYYMVASDGGVFAFGDARFRGSMGNTRLNRPVVGLVPTPDNSGYWLVASDGGVFAFNARFSGSMGGTSLNQPIRSMVPYGSAYLMIASDGGVFNFSDSPFFGSKGGTPIAAPISSGTAIG